MKAAILLAVALYVAVVVLLVKMIPADVLTVIGFVASAGVGIGLGGWAIMSLYAQAMRS